MAVRTTSEHVQEILVGHYDGKTDLARFIATASSLVDWLVRKDTAHDLDAAALELIECYLAAHFYTHSDKIAQSKSTSGAGGTFQGQTAMVLMSTDYGQTACILDTTLRLAEHSKAAEKGVSGRVAMEWLGKRPSEQIPYEDRS